MAKKITEKDMQKPAKIVKKIATGEVPLTNSAVLTRTRPAPRKKVQEKVVDLSSLETQKDIRESKNRGALLGQLLKKAPKKAPTQDGYYVDPRGGKFRYRLTGEGDGKSFSRIRKAAEYLLRRKNVSKEGARIVRISSGRVVWAGPVIPE